MRDAQTLQHLTRVRTGRDAASSRALLSVVVSSHYKATSSEGAVCTVTQLQREAAQRRRTSLETMHSSLAFLPSHCCENERPDPAETQRDLKARRATLQLMLDAYSLRNGVGFCEHSSADGSAQLTGKSTDEICEGKESGGNPQNIVFKHITIF